MIYPLSRLCLRNISFVMVAIMLLCDVEANLFHIPGVSRETKYYGTNDQQDDSDDPTKELYFVCSVAEDDERDDVMEHLDAGADVNWVSDEEGITCLFSAVMKGKLQVVETVLDHGADISIPRKMDGLTPIHGAALYGRSHALQAFYDRGLLPHLDDVLDGIPLLHRACDGYSMQHRNTITFLVRHGADINQPDWLGRTCLDKATRKSLIFHIEDLGGKRSGSL